MEDPQCWRFLKLCMLSCFMVVDAFHDDDELTGTMSFFSERWMINARNGVTGSVGFTFTTVRSFTITALGRPLTIGTSTLSYTIRVSIWDPDNQAAELAGADVGPSSIVEDLYAYEVLATPLEVLGGKEYRMSILAQSTIPDKWTDGNVPAADLATGSATEYAIVGHGCSVNGNGYPSINEGAGRRAGIANFKIAFDCAAPSGIVHAGTYPCAGISGNGSSTGHVPNGENCTAQCKQGYSPSVLSLSCSDGVLSPSTFECSPSACTDLVVANALDPPCAEGNSVPPGGICTAQCLYGYTPSDETLNCSHGQYTPLTFTCVGIPCAVLLPFVGAVSEPCSSGFIVSHGENCSTQCANGYTPSKPFLLCNLGVLSPGSFTCSPDPCVAPYGIHNAGSPSCRQGVSILSGENCTTRCMPGYTASVDVLYCSLGSLSPSVFSCSPSQCDVPLMDENTGFPPCSEGSTIESGSSCTPRCRPGYVTSVSYLNCSLGELEPLNFTCHPLACRVPTGIAHAAPQLCAEGFELTSGSICTVQCSEGYSPFLDTLFCNLGQLSLPNVSLCAPSKCQPPPINGAADPPCLEGPSVESGEYCTPQCTSGHTPSELRLNCSFGELSPTNFSCDRNPCSVPQAVPNAISPLCLEGIDLMISGSTCTVQCEPGYTPNSAELACDLGVLTPADIGCFPSPCVVPATPNSASPACLQGNSVQSGGICTAACTTGFTPSVENLTCSLGILTPPNFTCYYDPCTVPSVAFAHSPACAEGDVVASGSSCTPHCLPGYDASDATIPCIAGAFTPTTFTCLPRPCVAPTIALHSLGCLEGTTIQSGGTCTAVCREGYLPTTPTLTCTLGLFDPFGFECNGDSCVVPSDIPNAANQLCAEISNEENISHSELCTLQCAAGYTPSVVSLNCTAGQLSPSSFQCYPSSCVPPTIANALAPCVEGNSIGHGKSCTTQCDFGYRPSLANLTCSLGDLIPQDFECVGDPCSIPPPAPDFGVEWPCGPNITLIAHGTNCTGQCQDGYSAHPIGLNCSGSQLNPPNFTCHPSACIALDIPNGMSPSCLEGASVEHGSICTTQCQVGFQPSVAQMNCRYGELYHHPTGWKTFQCNPLDCIPPKIWFALQPCVEGPFVPSGSPCTAQCARGFTPSVSYLNCSLGILTPPTFTCLGEECPVPSDVKHIADAPCAEGNESLVHHRSTCTPQCASGYLPSVLSLDCYNGTLSPLPLQCWHCPEVARMIEILSTPRRGDDIGLGGVVTRAESMACTAFPEDYWCHNRCGAMRVSYTTSTRGLAWVAMGLFRPATCAEFPPWYPTEHFVGSDGKVAEAVCSLFSPWCPSSELARTDLLVTTVADMKDLHPDVLRGNGFQGVVILLSFECGALHVPPPSLRCWQSRVLLVGGDRYAGLHNYGGYLEMPPALISWLMRKSSQPADTYAKAETALTQSTRDLVLPKTKLLAYLSDNCSAEEETFFDLAVEAIQGYGTIEALGRCHGSHPELVPKSCGGACEHARQNPLQALRPFKFVLAFDASAGTQNQCAKHITHRVFDALAAGAVPVYRGPDETFAVLNHDALVHVQTHSSLQEGLMVFRASVVDPAGTQKKMTMAALTPDARNHWFRSEEALKGVPNDFTQEVQSLVAPMLRGGPHYRCAEQELLRTPLPCDHGSPSTTTCSRTQSVHPCLA